MNDVIERLRASKAKAEEIDYEAGKIAGSQWAKTKAEYYELLDFYQSVEKNGCPETVDDLMNAVNPDAEWTGDAKSGVNLLDEITRERRLPNRRYLRGFAEGIIAVWREIAPQL